MVGNCGLLDLVEPSHKVRRFRVESACKPNDHGESRVAITALDLGQVGSADPCTGSEVHLTQLPATSKFAQPRTERMADARVPLVGHVRIVRTRPPDPLRPSTRRVTTSTTQEDA